MSVKQLLLLLQSKQIDFKDVLTHITEHYIYTPTSFYNGNLHNTTDQNQGSAKVLFFAQLHDLSEEQTLQLFAEHYNHVIASPLGIDHQNIRQFMQMGWNGVKFENTVLRPK